MRILYMTNYFPPEVGTGPHLPYELGAELVRAGHEVTVVTCFPRYNLPDMPKKYRRRMLFEESMEGMRVLRINAPNFYGSSIVSRGLVQLLAPPLVMCRALLAERPDVVFTDTPPQLIAIAARIVAWRFRVPCVAQVMDLFPQTVIELGLLRNRLAIRIFQFLEQNIYRKTPRLVVLCEGYKKHAVKRGADPQRTHVVPTWAELDAIRPAPRLNEFRKEHGLHDEFVVVFAGTMGFAQGLNTVIEAARIVADEPGLVFMMVGNGVERERLEQQANGLANVRFLPMQPKEVYPQVLAASDAALVTLHPQMTAPSVPSKIMTIMAAGRPIVASLPPEGGEDARAVIEESGCGLVVPAGDHAALASAILKIKHDHDLARQMGLRGRDYAESHYSLPACAGRIADVMEQAVTLHASAAEIPHQITP